MEDDHDHASQRRAALVGETLSFFVKATGKDETLMRQKLTSRKLENLRKERDHWKARAQKKSVSEGRRRKHGGSPKDSQVSNGKRGEEFEEEFGRKVRNVMGNSRGEQEKAVQKWSSEMQRAIQQQERRCEPRKRTIMEQEGSNS